MGEGAESGGTEVAGDQGWGRTGATRGGPAFTESLPVPALLGLRVDLLPPPPPTTPSGTQLLLPCCFTGEEMRG